jgi:hypothetical protein
MAAALGLVAPAYAEAQKPPADHAKPSGDAQRPPSDPPYPHGSYVGECGLCHASAKWSPAVLSPKFDHAKFGFRLDGAHNQASCRGCHLSLDFSKAKPKKDCDACHSDVHLGEFGQDCARCHTPRSFIDDANWRRGHQRTRFPLTGAHLAADCEACHKPVAQGHLRYVNLPTQCVDCHLKDYQSAKNPDHVAAGLSQDCAQCHNTIAFVPGRAGFHDAQFFPIYSGRHKGVWDTCADCHTNLTDFSTFSCLGGGCHAHSSQTETNNQHVSVPGYSYNSQACYTCHPQGRVN